MKSDDLINGLTLMEVEGFVSSRFWQAVTETTKERLELIRSILEVGSINFQEGENVVTRPATYEELKGFMGECKSLRYLLSLPEIFKEQKIQEALLKEQKEANDE